MKKTLATALLGILVGASAGAGQTAAASLPTGFVDELVQGGFIRPMSLRFLSDGRIVVTERSPARLLVLAADGSPLGGASLEIPDVPGDGERGLLSIAVDPQWSARPYLYAYFNSDSGGFHRLRLSRFTASGDLDGDGDGVIDFSLDSELPLVEGIPDRCPNHNGGDLRFLPDRTLLLSVGDDENKCAATGLGDPLGKLLRLDVGALPAGGSVSLGDLVPPDNPFVDRPGAFDKLTWALGLRNPFRMHVDPLNGSVFVADVGWTQREEVSHLESGGAHLGWPYREGLLEIAASVTACACWTCDCTAPPTFEPLDPIVDYGRDDGRSVISAGIYRRSESASRAWPEEYEGDYFLGDFYAGTLRRLDGSGQSWGTAPAVAGQTDPEFWATGLGFGVVSFELGPDGSLYYLNLDRGELRRIAFRGGTEVEHPSFGAFKTRFSAGDGRQ